MTVLSGAMAVAFGRDGARDQARPFGPGDYYVNARGAVPAVWVDEAFVIQITGVGPWEAQFVEDWRAASDPGCAGSPAPGAGPVRY